MVVIAIVGIVSGAAVLALPDPSGGLRTEAVRFAARVRAAQERAVMESRPVAVLLRPGSYAFEWRRGGRWEELGEKPFIEQSWSKGTEAALEGGETRIQFDSTGFAETARLRLVRGGDEVRVAVADGARVRVEP
jgi:general secretion pathway protein H